MNIKIKIFILVLIVLCELSIYGQCYRGDQKQHATTGTKVKGKVVATSTTQSYWSIDPNEIVGLEGYDAPESTDTLRWVSATQSLAYTVYFENDAELAMAAVSTSGFRKSFMAASSMCVHDFMLEIPLAHCVRGGMVRCADGRGGGRRAADENVPLLVTSFSPSFFFPFCLQARHTIPRNVTALSGISSFWQQTSKKRSLT